MNRKTLALIAGLLVVLVASEASGDPTPPARPTVYHVVDPFKVTLASGRVVDMAPSYIAPDAAWRGIDAELRRLQTAETRLTAERDSLAKSAADAGPGWGTLALVATALAAGIAAGAAVY